LIKKISYKTDPMSAHKYIIGIDPGTKTGLAVWDCEKKQFKNIDSMKIHEAMTEVMYWHKYAIVLPILVRFEDARLRKWFGKNSNEKQQGAGSIKRDCAIWEDFLRDSVIDFQLVAPKDIKTKMTAAAFRNLTGWKGVTNEHGRDAAMLVFGWK